jgi:hypothetical protein
MLGGFGDLGGFTRCEPRQRDPRAASRTRAAAPRGSSRCGWLGRRHPGVQPLFLTFLRDGPHVGAPEVQQNALNSGNSAHRL